MKVITILLLTISLVSCRSIERQMICKELKNQEIKPVTLCDISFQFNRCRCRTFNFNKWQALDAPVNLPIEACEGMAGFKLEEIATEISPKIKAMGRLKDNLCDEN
jgi:hypothetical protein